MPFEWDVRKDFSNQRKHGIEFSVAELVFSDPLAKFTQDREIEGEERWLIIGRTPGELRVAISWRSRTRFSTQESMR